MDLLRNPGNAAFLSLLKAFDFFELQKILKCLSSVTSLNGFELSAFLINAFSFYYSFDEARRCLLKSIESFSSYGIDFLYACVYALHLVWPSDLFIEAANKIAAIWGDKYFSRIASFHHQSGKNT
jgi:hypothetical protein